LFRRIPNWDGYFDYDSMRPEVAAFVPRPQDEGALSADLKINEAMAALSNPKLKGFGICAIDVVTISAQCGPEVWVEATGPSHVRIHGCSDPHVQAALSRIATVLRPPTPTPERQQTANELSAQGGTTR
jgi:hypothetical protein